MRLRKKVVGCWREIDIFFSKNGAHCTIEVECVDDVEESMDEGLHVSCFGIVLAIREVNAAEESLLNQRGLVLPGRELDQELLEERVLVLWSHFAW